MLPWLLKNNFVFLTIKIIYLFPASRLTTQVNSYKLSLHTPRGWLGLVEGETDFQRSWPILRHICLCVYTIMMPGFDTQGRYPENFMLISQLEVCQEGGYKKESTWRKLRVSDWRHGRHGHSWHHEWCLFTPRKMPWKFRVDILIRSMSIRGGQ